MKKRAALSDIHFIKSLEKLYTILSKKMLTKKEKEDLQDNITDLNECMFVLYELTDEVAKRNTFKGIDFFDVRSKLNTNILDIKNDLIDIHELLDRKLTRIKESKHD